MASSTFMTNNTYLLTLQASCQTRKHSTPTQPQLTSFDYFVLFHGKSVDQSERTIYKSALSKQKQTTTLHQGWAFKRCDD